MTVPRIALMLYTVRDRAATDLRGTLEFCKACGCDGVEFAGLHGNPASTVRGWLNGLGLSAASMHAGLGDLDTKIESVLDDARQLGLTRVVMPWVPAPKSKAEAAEVMVRVRRAAAWLKERGVGLGYHNHDFEFHRFDDGTCMWDMVIAAQELFLEPDVGWIWFAGRDPVAEVTAMGRRVPLVHAKDFGGRAMPPVFCPVGTGAVPMEAAMRAAVAVGAEWLIAEQDQAEDPMGAAAECVANLRAIRDRVVPA